VAGGNVQSVDALFDHLRDQSLTSEVDTGDAFAGRRAIAVQ
jgi:hypothetical protein